MNVPKLLVIAYRCSYLSTAILTLNYVNTALSQLISCPCGSQENVQSILQSC